jgi:hypothetical protein
MGAGPYAKICIQDLSSTGTHGLCNAHRPLARQTAAALTVIGTPL